MIQKTALLFCLLLLTALTAAFYARATAVAEPDWNKATEEATKYLSELIRIKTPQPEGNEIDAARYLKTICDREGIENYIFESGPRRANFVARLKGDGSARPVLLMAHLDTVGVEPALWSDDPFSGKIENGFVYGRGAQDDKNIMAAHLEAFLLIKRSGVALRRDIILLGEADEEQGTGFGVEWMIQNKPEFVDAEFSVTEGGTSLLDAATNKVRYFAIQTTEKIPINFKVATKGVSGHASIPHPENPVVRLAHAISAIGRHETPVQFNETTTKFFAGLAATATGDDKKFYDSVVKAAAAKNADQQELKRLAREVAKRNFRFAAIMRTTISPTVMKGGFQNNVIPGTAEANLNIRLFPFDTTENILAQLKQAVNDPNVEFSINAPVRRRSLPESSPNTEMFRAFEKAVGVMSPGAPVMPYMSTWATDSSQLRERGVQAYGVLWPNTPEEEAGFHGNDERIRIASLGYGVQVMWRVLMETAVKK